VNALPRDPGRRPAPPFKASPDPAHRPTDSGVHPRPSPVPRESPRGAEKRLAPAAAYEKQVAALGQGPTALVNLATVLSRSTVPFMPGILVAGGSGQGVFEGLAASVMGMIRSQTPTPSGASPPAKPLPPPVPPR
jgi:hypothetical protein